MYFTVPAVTECVTCGKVAVRGRVTVCGRKWRRTPKGRERLCQGRLFRREDLEDAIRSAATLGGVEAGDAMIAHLMIGVIGL